MKLLENVLGRVTKPVRGVLSKIAGFDKLKKLLEGAAIGAVIVIVLIIAIAVLG